MKFLSVHKFGKRKFFLSKPKSGSILDRRTGKQFSENLTKIRFWIPFEIDFYRSDSKLGALI